MIITCHFSSFRNTWKRTTLGSEPPFYQSCVEMHNYSDNESSDEEEVNNENVEIKEQRGEDLYIQTNKREGSGMIFV